MGAEPLRILQLVQRPQRRGAEVFAFQLCGALERRGCATRIVYLYPHAGEGKLPLRAGDLELGGDEHSLLERIPGHHPGLLRRLERAIADFAPDVVQVNGARTVKYGALARRGAGWRLVYRNIGDPAAWVRGRLRRFWYRRFIVPRVDGVVGVSAATLERLQSFYRLDVEVAQIPRGIDPGELVPQKTREQVREMAGVSGDAPVVVYLGSLSSEKRLDRLLRVTAKAAAELPALEVWIIGGGPQRQELERLAAGGPAAVRFWGVQTEVASLLAAADLLLLTSDTEGIPGVVLEAGWLGVPAVATRVGGVAECVEDGVTGLLAEPDAEPAFAAAAVALLRDGERRRQMGEAAHARVAKGFTIDAMAERYLDFYRRVVEGPP